MKDLMIKNNSVGHLSGEHNVFIAHFYIHIQIQCTLTVFFLRTPYAYACCWQIYVAILIYPHLVLLAWIVIVFDPTKGFWIYI